MEEQVTQETANEEAVPVEPVEPEATQWEKEWSPDDEEQARFLGWKDPSEWQGEQPPQGLIEDPREYNERAERFLPVRKLQERLSKLEEESNAKLRKLESVYDRALENQRKQAEAAIQNLRQQQARFAEDGDMDGFKQAQEREEAIRKQISEQQPQEAQEAAVPDDHRRAIDNWAVDKDWFKTDQIMTQAAATAYGEAQQRGMSDPQAILKYVDRRLEEAFPHKFQKAQRQTATVSTGLAVGSAPDSFSKLPTEAKEAFKKFVKQGLFTDDKAGRDAYSKEYNDA